MIDPNKILCEVDSGNRKSKNIIYTIKYDNKREITIDMNKKSQTPESVFNSTIMAVKRLIEDIQK